LTYNARTIAVESRSDFPSRRTPDISTAAPPDAAGRVAADVALVESPDERAVAAAPAGAIEPRALPLLSLLSLLSLLAADAPVCGTLVESDLRAAEESHAANNAANERTAPKRQ